MAGGPADHRAGAQAPGGAGGGRADGHHLGRGARRDRGLPRSHAVEGLRADPHRGRHRRRVHSHDPRRPGAGRRRPRHFRRVPRAQPGRRPRPCARARRAGRAAGRPEDPGDVGHPRRRGGRRTAGRRRGDREPRPRLSGRDPLPRPRRAAAARGSGHPRRGAGARGGGRLDPRLSPRPGRDPARGRAAGRAPAPAGRRRRSPLWRSDPGRAGPGDPPRAAGPAQGRAGHLDRRDQPDHRGRARGGGRGSRARPAVRSGERPDPARHGPRQPRRRRPAPRPLASWNSPPGPRALAIRSG